MDVVLCSYYVVQKGERRGEDGRGWPGKVPRSPAAPLRKKEGRRRKKQLADRKVPDRPGVVKGEGYKKKYLKCTLPNTQVSVKNFHNFIYLEVAISRMRVYDARPVFNDCLLISIKFFSKQILHKYLYS
jgi:hypothetical protein